KDTHFEAIHNVIVSVLYFLLVVRANAKIHILKQFTTCDNDDNFTIQLYVLMQRYTF
ncbi:hypothetical protein HMPREF9148_02689, partial [Prevotella sp. F0091]